MNNLVDISLEKQTVSARRLHERLKITDRFSRWFERMTGYGFQEGVDYTSVKTSTVVNNGAERELQDYELSIDMAKEICMIQRTPEGKKVREYLIQLEKKWNTPELVMARALKMAAGQIDDLKLENKHLTAKIEADKPKTIFADAVTASDSAILVRDLAKLIRQNGYEISGNWCIQYSIP